MSQALVRRTKLAVLPSLAAGLVLPASAHAATADLSLAKSDNPDPVAKGSELTYTIAVSNLGPDTASGVTVTDDLPNQVDFVSVTTTKGACDRKGNKVTCDLGALAPANYTGATITIKVRPQQTGTIENKATVEIAKADTDPVPANNSDTETTRVTGGGGAGGPSCAGRTATQVGTGGADTLIGTNKRDVIVARGGGDLVRGLRRGDIVCGNSGNDTLKGGAGADLLKGGRGRDRLRGGRGNDRLRGGGGNDRCRGGAGSDTEKSC